MVNLQVAEGLSIDNNAGFGYSPGDIIISASNFVPSGFLSCDGSTITQGEYPSLFSVLGTYYDAAGLVCKLPNINAQVSWTFPCSTVGSEAAYVVTSSAHTHSSATPTITAESLNIAEHNHNMSVATGGANTPAHSHYVINPGNSVNVASTQANRSNGAGQGANLAINGHTHSWGSYADNANATDNHNHNADIGTTCSASSHTHTATLTTTNTSSAYILNNVISMRYYIKW
jgi:microcystin-dependent protein